MRGRWPRSILDRIVFFVGCIRADSTCMPLFSDSGDEKVDTVVGSCSRRSHGGSRRSKKASLDTCWFCDGVSESVADFRAFKGKQVDNTCSAKLRRFERKSEGSKAAK